MLRGCAYIIIYMKNAAYSHKPRSKIHKIIKGIVIGKL